MFRSADKQRKNNFYSLFYYPTCKNTSPFIKSELEAFFDFRSTTSVVDL